MLVAITGTPGSGKSHFARMLARRIPDAVIIEINDVVDSKHAFSGYDEFSAKVVKLRPLSSAIIKEVGRNKGKLVILVGHLFPELAIRSDVCVVMRSGLRRLMKILSSRGYPPKKVSDNVIAEALDYCGTKAAERSAETYEIESFRDKQMIISYISRIWNGKGGRRPAKNEISKMGELHDLIKNGAIALD
jgi:adenylate kinase